MRKLLFILLLCTSCSTVRQGYTAKRLRMDSVLRTMTPEEVREYQAQKTTAKIMVIAGIVVVVVNTIPLVEYDKRP